MNLIWALLGTLASCAPPKAVVITAGPTVAGKVEKKPEAEVAAEPAVPELPQDDGIRMPNMLDLPSDGDFRATNPAAPGIRGESGTVISRPPTDPPSRVKPKE